MIADPDDRVPTDSELAQWCEQLAELAEQNDRVIATAESLTAGNIAAELGRASESGDWYSGGIIAYRKQVKHDVLHVPDGPVVSEAAATAMARSTAALLGADLTVAVTGEAGPETQEDVPPGTVWFGVYDNGSVQTLHRVFEGEPPDVLAATIATGVDLLIQHAKAGVGNPEEQTPRPGEQAS
ncbi:nicotinamide-nucleotide amidase [Williamsia limnetica]|jgi:nicotinamide-nucleotide amidase|uniref:Nicotinamide-nucleotide amidase n=1 Tax=Williamsia limnetica TaxID=882452 RepID=A0A318RL00_WILLI|nr:CinA family protein [Williamsia limnetica]PYE17470.1 nicotinamide-nucleotide amidase [Williamsia limnetica]